MSDQNIRVGDRVFWTYSTRGKMYSGAVVEIDRIGTRAVLVVRCPTPKNPNRLMRVDERIAVRGDTEEGR